MYERFALDGSHFDEESISLRYATEKEAAILMDALEENGKKWDAGRHKVLPLYEEDISIRELQQNFNALLHDFKLLEAAHKRKVEECEQFRIELSEVKTHVGQLDVAQAELPRKIKRFEQSEFVEIGLDCPFHYCVPPTDPANLIIKVGSNMCMNCRHFMKGDVFEKKCVLCAARYDEKDLHQK